MIYYVIYVGIELFLYLAILRLIEKGPFRGKTYQRRLLFWGCWIAMVCMKNIRMREEATLFISIVYMFSYLWAFLMEKKNYMYIISIVISTVAITLVLSVILAVPCSYIWYLNQGKWEIYVRDFMILLVKIIICIVFTVWRERIPLYKLYRNKSVRFLSACIGLFLIVLEQVGLQLYDDNKHIFSVMVGNIFIFLIIFSVLWLLDHYRLAAGKLKVEQDNRKMNSNLHKTKELMPLLISVVNENEGLLDPQLVEEFNQIYSEQMITGREENMNYKLLGTTGIKLLDSQLQHYILECSRKGIVMDVFASEPIGKQLHEMHIAQLMMHNVMGDLLRNAIRAIERSGRTDGKILVILGKKEGIVELDIFDNGDEIPFSILEKFGKRGLTTGGTGNGLADIAEMLKDYKISLVIKENESGSSTYVKGFMLVFDGKNRRELRTCRSGKEKLKKIGYWTVVSEEAFGEKEG